MADSDRVRRANGAPREPIRPVRRGPSGGWWTAAALQGLLGAALLAMVPVVFLAAPRAVAQDEADDTPLGTVERDPPDPALDAVRRAGDTDAPDDEPAEVDDESGVALPTDRLKERQLDRVRRLAADGRWSDSATLVDEILGGDRDFFFRPGAGESTWRSIKSETTRLLGEFPDAGREAYELQFRSRAERLLDQAIAGGDGTAVVAVARRWFHTPAGRRATLLAALDALETGRPLEAAAWLDRLAGAPASREFEPTLSVMRAVAWWHAGERQVATAILDGVRQRDPPPLRVGGREVRVNHPPGGAAAWLEEVAGPPASGPGRGTSEWWVHRGNVARNALVEASRPLLVPRYRVPLTRHPEEARLLERRRKLFADRDMPLLPAATPLAIGGLVVVHSPMGLLAVDFETGKRVWLQTAGAAASFFDAGTTPGEEGEDGGNAEARAAIRGVFEDATSGTLSSDGELVFVVESDPASLAGPAGGGLDMFRQFPSGPRGSNSLSAYRLANRGTLAWRLSGAPAAGRGDPAALPQQMQFQASQGKWFLGAPLPIGDQLFVLVEERGEIRLEVLAAADGAPLWSQPLAELDDGMAIANRESHLRRVGGLSPSFADGVLVCPTGAGTVVAVDLATRTLLWAYTYSQPRTADSMLLPNGVRVQRGGGGAVIVNGRVMGMNTGPTASTGWRDSSPVLSAGKIVLTPRESDEIHCLDLRGGSVLWKAPRQDGLYVAGVVDGRAIVVGRRGVRSLALADGGDAWSTATPLEGACPSGRGVLTSRSLFLPLDTPEVVEIDLADGSVAGRSPARGGQVAGNLVAYRGEVVSLGVDALDVYHQSSALDERIDTARRERPADPWAGLWAGQLDIDRGNVAAGLESVLAARAAAAETVPQGLLRDALLAALGRDFPAALAVWKGRGDIDVGRSRPLQRIIVDGHLRAGDVESAWQALSGIVGDVVSPWERGDRLETDAVDRSVSIGESAWMAGRFRRVLEAAPASLRDAIDARVGAEVAAAEALRPVAERAERLAALEQWFAAHPAGARAREVLIPAIGDLITATGATSDAGRDLAVRRDLLRVLPAAPSSATVDAAWPFGRVVERKAAQRGGNDDPNRMARLVPIAVEGTASSAFPGMRLSFDMQQPGFVVLDGFGRRLGEPFGVETQGRGDPWSGFQPYTAEASVVGRVLVVRSGGTLIGCELTDVPGQRHRRLWTVHEQTGVQGEMAVMPFLGRGMGERQARLENVPLGLDISEPDAIAAAPTVEVGNVRATGLPVLVNTTLELRDPVTGGVRWERHRLAAGGDLVGDDDYVCVVPAGGKQATVLSMIDGSLVRTCDLPPRGRRLLACGRRLVVIGGEAAADGRVAAPAGPVPLTLLDPVTMERVALGTFSRDALAARAGVDAFAVVEPNGTITVIDLGDGRQRFRAKLPEMPSGLEQVRVTAWEDRFLVFVGRRETPEERKLMEKVGMITSLPQQFSREVVQPATGSLWALDRTSGEMLWPVPATILRHCVHPGQPERLPVLLFARQIQRGGTTDRLRLGILAIDKRTGQALVVDDKLGTQPQFLAGCEMVGDPAAHTVSVGRGGGEGGDVVLEFTGEPTAPRPPFQAASRQPLSRDVLSELEHWLEKVIQLPIPSF